MRLMRAGGSPNRSAPYAPSPQLRAHAPSRGVPPPTPETHSRPIGRSGERLRPIGRAFLVGYRFVLRYPNKARRRALCRFYGRTTASYAHGTTCAPSGSGAVALSQAREPRPSQKMLWAPLFGWALRNGTQRVGSRGP